MHVRCVLAVVLFSTTLSACGSGSDDPVGPNSTSRLSSDTQSPADGQNGDIAVTGGDDGNGTNPDNLPIDTDSSLPDSVGEIDSTAVISTSQSDDNLDDNVSAGETPSGTTVDIVSAEWVEEASELNLVLNYNGSSSVAGSNGDPISRIFGVLLLDLDANSETGVVGLASSLSSTHSTLSDTAFGAEAYVVLENPIDGLNMLEFIDLGGSSTTIPATMESSEITLSLPRQILNNSGMGANMRFGVYLGEETGPTDQLFGLFNLAE